MQTKTAESVKSGMPLSFSKVGETGTITRISGDSATKKFLCDLGFTVGTKISTISDIKGSKILSIRGSKIAVDSSMASKIIFCPE